MKLYLTNQLVNRKQAREIQVLIENETSLVLDNPFYLTDGTPTKEIGQLDAGEKTSVSDAEIVATDCKKIREADGVLAFMTHKSVGSPMEIFYAHDILAKPVYVIVPEWSEIDPEHPWLRHCSTEVFRSVKDFVEFAKENLK